MNSGESGRSEGGTTASRVARSVVAHRRWVVAALVSVATVVGAFAPSIEVQFEPEELVAPDADAREEREALHAAFGPPERALVVVVEASDVRDASVLRWMHGVARALGAVRGVTRVEGLSTTPLPHPRDPDEAGEGAEDLDDLGEAPLEGPSLTDDPMLRALGAIAAADPERWPMGLLSIADRGEAVSVRPSVAGEVPTDAELAAMRALAADPLVRGRLVSSDGTVAVLAAILDEGADRATIDAAVRAADALRADAPPGVRASLSGLPAIRLAMIDALRSDQALLISLAALASLVVLVVGTRSVAGVVLPLGTVGLTVAITVGGMAIAGQPINLLTNMIPPLLVTIGLAEAVHMVLRWEEEVRAGASPVEAAARTMETMWLACFVTTFTTAVGFGALMLQETEILRVFGAIAGAASMLAYVVTVLFVPTMLPSFRPAQARARQGSVGLEGGPRADGDASEGGWLERAMTGLAGITARRWKETLAGALALLLGSLWVARGVGVDSTLMDQFARDSEVARTTRVLEAHLDGVRALDIGLRAAPGHFDTPEGVATLHELAAWLRAQPGVLRVTSEADWLEQTRALVREDAAAEETEWRSPAEIAAYRALLAVGRDEGRSDPLARFVTPDGAMARLEVRLADRGASRILAMLDAFRARATREPGLAVTFAGEAYDASRGLDRIVRSLGSLGAAVALIFGVMTLLFRSVRLGLLSVPPNALPLAMTLAYMALRGIALNAATVIVFTVTLGLAVDGATHVIARFREEAVPGRPAGEVVLRTVAGSGRGVVLASVTLLLGYGALLFSAFEPVRLFGELSFVAIFGSLIAQVVLLPSLLATFALPGQRPTRPSSETSHTPSSGQ